MSSRYTCAGAEGAPSARAARRVSEFALQGVESSPKAAVVYTLSIGKDDRASDAYSEESQFIADRMAEIESVSARKATLLNPTEDDETVQVLRRRLFDRINDRDAANVIAAYRESWNSNRDSVISEASRPETIDAFRASYPFHPDVLATLTGKTATLVTFQRVRGMLRLLAGTVAYLWNTKPADATAIHLHHVDPGFPPIYEEIATRLGQRAYVPAIRNDIVAAEPGKKALAQDLDDAHYRGMAPYASYVARTIFIHTLAYNDQLKGITPEHLRYSILGPETDISFIDDARKRFFEDSSYLDDRPTAPLRFLVEANLTQIIRRQELHADAGQVRAELNDRIKRIFGGTYFEIVPFWLSCHTMACSATKFSSARFARASSTAFTSNRSGTLLYGPGDPNADIRIDENSVLFTMDYARQHDIWPRSKVDTGGGAPGGKDAGSGASGGGGTGAGADTGAAGGDGATAFGGAGGDTGTSSQTFTAEAVLREALMQLWEKARKAKVDKIGVLKIKVFDATDAFRLIGTVSSISGAAKTAKMDGGYETKEGATMTIDFSGPLADALPVKDFLDSQMRAAAEKKLDSTFEIRFNDGVAMTGDAAEKLTDRLTRFATGSAYVSASAEAKA
jgi:hypothetical protein